MTPQDSILLRFLRRPHVAPLLIYTAIVFVLLWPTYGLYAWVGHEMVYPFIRVQQMSWVWSAQGPFHVPWMPEACYGYGLPFFTFYAPFGYYVGAAFHVFARMNVGLATRMSYYLALYLSGLMMYGFVWSLDRQRPRQRAAWWGLATATIYAVTPYHLADTFARSSLSGAWGWAAAAGLFWAVEASRDRPWRAALPIAAAYAWIVLSHNLLALYASILVALYVLGTASRWKWPLVVAGGAILGAGLSAYYWLPAVRLLPLVRASSVEVMWGEPAKIHSHAIYWRQFFVETPGKMESDETPNDAFPMNLGYLVTAGAALALVALFRPGLSRGERRRIVVCLALIAALMFVMSPQMPWGSVPATLRYIQFPWRLLLFTTFFGCAALGFASPVLDRWLHPGLLAAAAAYIAIVCFPAYLTRPGDISSDFLLQKWNEYAEANHQVFLGCYANEYKPLTADDKYLNKDFHATHPPPANRLALVAGKLTVVNFEHEGTGYKYRYTAPADAQIVMHVFHFPGWELTFDGRPASEMIERSADGLISLHLPAGDHQFRLHYGLSPIGRAARWITVAAWVAWVALRLGPAILSKIRSRSTGAHAATK